ncbi:hypothetical protein IP70_15840 [alpha proteobacterium AAP38]|nr:hypothetical protein IP70_15840 [alpha proteobacterium AAP38]
MTRQATAQEIALAERIVQRAKDTLAPIEREMRLMDWPAACQAIMWQAVMAEATRLLIEAERG